MMTPRERVLRTLAFTGPDRPPCTFPAPYVNDLCGAGMSADPDWKPWRTYETVNGLRQWEDEFHNVWRCLPNTTRGEVVQGALPDWADLDHYAMPRLDLEERYRQPAEVFAAHPDHYHLGSLAGFPFAIMRYMRTVETFLADVLEYPDEVMALQERVVDLLKRTMDRWKDAGADGVMFAEDWGTQERLLVSPALWQRLFAPGFEALLNHAHERDLDIWMHSCGYIRDIIPQLVRMGVKVLQLDQPRLSGLEFLAETCGTRTTIWSPVDIQKDLPTGEEPYIRERARELIRTLHRNGGFICGYYGDPRSLAVEPEWQMWAVDEFAKACDAMAG